MTTIRDLTQAGYEPPPLSVRIATYAAGGISGAIACGAVFFGVLWWLP